MDNQSRSSVGDDRLDASKDGAAESSSRNLTAQQASEIEYDVETVEKVYRYVSSQ